MNGSEVYPVDIGAPAGKVRRVRRATMASCMIEDHPWQIISEHKWRRGVAPARGYHLQPFSSVWSPTDLIVRMPPTPLLLYYGRLEILSSRLEDISALP